MIELLFKSVDHNQVIIESRKCDEWPIYAVSRMWRELVLMNFYIFPYERFILVLLSVIIYVLVFFLIKNSFVKNEFTVSHAVHSDSLGNEPIICIWNLNSHVMNFDNTRLDVSIKLDKSLFLMSMIKLERLAVLTWCYKVEPLFSFISPL